MVIMTDMILTDKLDNEKQEWKHIVVECQRSQLRYSNKWKCEERAQKQCLRKQKMRILALSLSSMSWRSRIFCPCSCSRKSRSRIASRASSSSCAALWSCLSIKICELFHSCLLTFDLIWEVYQHAAGRSSYFFSIIFRVLEVTMKKI